MTHPAYMLARLNAKNAKFEMGTGGSSDLTPQDIAAALAFVPKGIGRELLCRVWWPDGASQSLNDLDQMLVGIQFGEWSERMDVLVTAQMRSAMAIGQSSKRRAEAAIECARARMWPHIDGTFDLLRRAVIKELIDPRNCPDCGGRGHIARQALVTACVRCGGTGKTARGPVWRAAELKMKHSSYLAKWVNPYEWLFGYCSDAMADADRQLRHATVS